MDTLYSWTAKRAGAAITVEHSCGKLANVAGLSVDPHGRVLAAHPEYGTLVLDTTPHRDATTLRVNTGVSDLFFNNEQACEAYRLDLDDQDRTNRMRDAAEAMQSALRAAGIVPPTVDALWRDFERRL